MKYHDERIFLVKSATDLSHVGWSEDGGDDEDVADDAADDDECVQRRQEVHREVRNCLIVHNVLKKITKTVQVDEYLCIYGL